MAAMPCSVSSCSSRAQRLRSASAAVGPLAPAVRTQGLCGAHRGRGCCRERSEHLLVGGAEVRAAGNAVEGHQQAEAAAAKGERDVQP